MQYVEHGDRDVIKVSGTIGLEASTLYNIIEMLLIQWHRKPCQDAKLHYKYELHPNTRRNLKNM